ncbi:serine/threonine-protein kinase ppk34-like [Aplysia californica]|uniref:Serine/threonine-protein kinase ppk34-like n=1 Tax=Aplysia californica TaxID=6500 RepID=A0ABM0K4D6_APLCA|nr:serine/threonine-protein kinase ppk34-like [Aplysia californica]
MACLKFPDVTVIRDGDFLENVNIKFVRVLAQKKNFQVLEASMKNDDSISKAIKKIPYLDSKGRHRDLKDSTEELTIMHNVQHPHLMKMDWVVTCDSFLAICMPLCSQGSLDGLRHSLQRDQVERVFVQTACALRYLHVQRCVHGDVKPANIFLDVSDNANLGDFGCSRILPDGKNTMDAYALGATLWSLVFRLEPADLDLLDSVRNASLPEMYRKVLHGHLRRDPQKRLSVSGLLEFLSTREKLRGIMESL